MLDVWREACRHIELDESAERMFSLVGAELGLASMAVYRFEEDERAFHLATSIGVDHEGFTGRLAVSADKRTELAAWRTRGELEPLASLDLFAGDRRRQPAGQDFAAPLSGADAIVGLLVLRFSGERVNLEKAARIVEPLAVATANDARLRELTVLREAAEAERSTLLKKLGMRKLKQEIVGSEGGLADVLSRVALVARTDTPVLIFGETGTGKEVIAREIHNQSDRAPGPFIRVNCGAIPPGLIDSELFGHERGSFTGAHKTRAGWFERADGGTLFLDEVGELPPEAQVRLLRVLQDGHFERVGGHHEVGVDVRVVAATHRDLSSMVGDGAFREDLWYRLAVFPIELPPLRDRPEDIPDLARHFAERAARRFGLTLQYPTESGLQALVEYSWPGNIRELAAVIDRAAILGDGRSLEVRSALGMAPGSGGHDTAARAATRVETAAATPASPKAAALLSLDEAMRRHIIAVLQATNGKIEGRDGAASVLELNPSTLRSRMRKLGIRGSGHMKSASTTA